MGRRLPLPPSRTATSGRKPNPDSHGGKIRALKIGEHYDANIPQARLSSIASRQRKGGKQFATRKTDTGARVWRVK